jgi:signal transduction histidine kinase
MEGTHHTMPTGAATGSREPQPGVCSAPPGVVAPTRGEILVVDDEPGTVQLLLEYLAVVGYGGTGTTSAAEAIAHLRSRPVDLMLCDLLMPEMSGIELMVKARLEAPDVAILVVTGVSDIETAMRAMRLGAYDYLVKPVSPGDVVLRVSSAMETRRHVLERRRAQERLQESYAQLQQMADVKDNLVQMLVHDLKTPLASAMGYMELLERKADATFSERQLHYLQHAYASCKDVLRMTATMLDTARLEQGALKLHCRQIELPALFRDLATEMTPLLDASAHGLETECHPGALYAFGDDEIVRRILGNLLANAARHTPPGSRVRLCAQPGGNGLVQISVSDNGKGVPPEHRERIFDKFFQLETNDRRGGLGIGLAFCRMAVEAHGGRIWVQGAPGGGSSFCFTLPPGPGESTAASQPRTGGTP